jgi:ATP-dependent Lhr-like helicase
VNDCLSRAVGYVIGREGHKDIEIGINDNGFYLGADRRIRVAHAIKLLKPDKLALLMNHAISASEIFSRRFRHCATRSLMILRNYRGHTKNVGRQQVGAQILLKTLQNTEPDFPILKEARREVLEDLMDIGNAAEVIRRIAEGRISLVEIDTIMPSPFAFPLVIQGYTDILKMEDRQEFLKRMHSMVLAKISLDEKKRTSKEPQEYEF